MGIDNVLYGETSLGSFLENTVLIARKVYHERCFHLLTADEIGATPPAKRPAPAAITYE
jgi:hypothetical protein